MLATTGTAILLDLHPIHSIMEFIKGIAQNIPPYVTGGIGEALGGARITNSMFSSYKEAQLGLSEVSANLAEISNLENGAELNKKYIGMSLLNWIVIYRKGRKSKILKTVLL
jgi:hypothetical protein